MILGTRALCIAEPRIDATGRAVYELNRYEFVPGSHKTILSSIDRAGMAECPEGRAPAGLESATTQQ